MPARETVAVQITRPKRRRRPATRGVRILLADDYPIVRIGLKEILAKGLGVAAFGEAKDGAAALELVSRQPWDVVLLDITMPGRNTLDVLQEMMAIQPQMAVLVLSGHSEDHYAIPALKAGAAGYISKFTSTEQLVEAVKKVLAGGKYISASIAEELAAGSHPAVEGPHLGALSARECQVMRLMVQGRDAKEISRELKLNVKTVRTYHTRILRKLKATSETPH